MWAIKKLAKRDCLLVLNYHRVGDKKSELFDELVYSATADELKQEVSHLNKKFGIVTLKDAQDFVSGRRRFGQPGVLLTFDDGYIDNYRIALPILRDLGVQGTFFLVSDHLTAPPPSNSVVGPNSVSRSQHRCAGAAPRLP